jgi:uncharacterized protein YjbJ (UPF0337 family)
MAVNHQTLEGNWNEIKGKVHDRWGQLTDDDLTRAKGSIEQLVGVIQQKTGESRGEIMDFLQDLTSEGRSALRRVVDSAQDSAHKAADSVRDTTQHAVDSMRDGYARTEDVVRRHPGSSLAVCFSAGLISGLVLGLIARAR